MTLPAIPQLPEQPTWDQLMRDFEARLRAAEYEQRIEHNAAAEQRNAALVAAHGRLAAAQERAATVGERTMDEGVPVDPAMVAAVVGLRQALEQWQPGANPQWAGSVRDALHTAAQALMAAAQAIQEE